MFIPMEKIFESITWIALGFVPTLVFLEMSWRMGKIKTSTKTIAVPAAIKA
jgi:hypothetical protein